MGDSSRNRRPDASQQVEALFAAALERAPEARAAFLEDACAGRPALRAEVASLLAAHDASGDFLETLDTDRAAALVESVGGPISVGQRVGPYRLVHEIGRGGMGAVFLAERVDGGFEQRVAVKLIKPGMNTAAILRRFLQERQIVARLQHPNIARLLDGGVADDGTPYFVMEYVEGIPITDYCEEHELSEDERLRLFQDVCGAVQYAHRTLVVHRDLKPSNIAVTSSGQVRLLDFGIAKLLAEEEKEGAADTPVPARRRVMTPAYGAPEQIRGEPVTVATDVFQLGLLLRELLTGERTRNAAHPMPADLEAIIEKAVRDEPDHRYDSAGALLEDVRRYRTRLPVRAHKDTPGYRTKKFVRRRSKEVIATTTVLLVLIGLTTFYVIQITGARDRAQLEAKKASRVTAFMIDLFKASDPWKAPGDPVNARDLLDQGKAQIQILRDQPLVKAQMLDALGRSYRSLGHYEESAPLLERALAIRRERLGPADTAVARSLNILGYLRYDQGNYDAAGALFRKALAIRRRLLGTEHAETATSMNNVAMVFYQQGEYAAAESLHLEALAIRRRLFPDGHEDVAESLNNLAYLYKEQGEYAAAEPLYREALAMNRRLYGDDHPAVAQNLNNLAVLLGMRKNYAAAEPYFREALAVYQRALGPSHPSVARALDNLGKLLMLKGDYAAAEPLYREALVMRRKMLGKEHPDVANSLTRLGTLHGKRGDYAAAESLYAQALALERRVYGDGHRDVAMDLHNLATARMDQGDYAGAEPLFLEALSIYRTMLPDMHPHVQITIRRLARLYEAWGKPEAAAHYRSLLVESTAVTVQY